MVPLQQAPIRRTQGRARVSRALHPSLAIANSRLIAFNDAGVTFTYKDYRANGRARHKRMTLPTHEFIRRFLLHVLPDGFHRIRHYGFFASTSRANNIARARELLAAPAPQIQADDAAAVETNEPPTLAHSCPCCGGRMIIIETFERGCAPRHQPNGPMIAIGIDTS
jgi:hypothetical protein